MERLRITVYCFFIGIFFCLKAHTAQAQPEQSLSKQVQVTRAYDPIISDANKITLPYQANDTLLSIRSKYKYTVQPPVLQASHYTLRPVPAARINENEYTDPQWLYARLGIGYPLRPLADLYITNIKPDNLSVGLQYNHRSIWANLDDNMPIDEIKHGATGFVSQQFEKVNVSAQLGFEQHKVLFYGYDTEILDKNRLPDFTFDKDSLSQRYTSIFVKGGVQSSSKDADALKYGAHALFDIFSDNGKKLFNRGRMFTMTENTFGSNAFAGKSINDGQHTFRLDADIKLYQRNLGFNRVYNSTALDDRINLGSLYRSLYKSGNGVDTSNRRMLLNISPSYILNVDKLFMSLGVVYAGFRQHDEFNSRLFPKVELRYDLLQELIPYLRFDGGVDMNDYRSIAAENPYISPGMNMNMKATERLFRFQLGFKGDIEHVFTYNLYGGYEALDNLYFYVNTSKPLAGTAYSLNNNFDVLYDDSRRINIGAELQTAISNLRTSLAINYFYYKMDLLPAAYHRPALIADWNTDLTIRKNWIFKLDVHAQGQSPYLYGTGTEQIFYNKAFFDINFGAEYLVNRSFSVFMLLNNIGNQKYEVWHQYKTPGIGVMGGITFKL